MNQYMHVMIDGDLYLIADIVEIRETCIILKGRPDGKTITRAQSAKLKEGLLGIGRVLDLGSTTKKGASAAPAAGG